MNVYPFIEADNASERERRQLCLLLAGQPVVAGTSVAFSLLDSLTHRDLGQVEVPGDLPDRPITRLEYLRSGKARQTSTA